MRKTIVFILLVVYSCNQLLPVFLYYHQPVVHTFSFLRHQLRQINRSRTETPFTITISTENYQLAKQDHNEIIWKGIRYDIEKIRISGNQVYLELSADRNEDFLLHLFARSNTISKTKGPNQKYPKPVKWFFKVYPLVRKTTILPASSISCNKPVCRSPHNLISRSLNQLEHPPEKYC